MNGHRNNYRQRGSERARQRRRQTSHVPVCYEVHVNTIPIEKERKIGKKGRAQQ
jgi:hypothetical protein